MCPFKWREVYFGGNTVNKIKLQQSQIHKYIRSKFMFLLQSKQHYPFYSVFCALPF